MYGNLFESLESRQLFSVAAPALMATEAPLAPQPALTVAAVAAAKLPRLVGTYRGNLVIPAVGHFKSVVLTIIKQNLKGKFTGTLNASGVSVAVSGAMGAHRTFKIALKGTHPGGPIDGTGTGSLNKTGKKLSISVNFVRGTQRLPGTLTLTKA